MGVLGEPNTSKRYKVDGAIANFRVKYASDGETASHVLSLTGYAADAGADEESWVLLGPAEGARLLLTTTQQAAPAPATTPAPLSARARSKQAVPIRAPAPVGGLDDAALGAMSTADMAALMVRLSAHMSGATSASDAALPQP